MTAVTRTQGATEALKDGDVSARTGSGCEFEEVPVLIQAFRRMVRSLDFDVTEMAFTHVPGAPGRTASRSPRCRSSWSAASTTARSSRGAPAGALAPKELEGRRVGVNRGYTVTTGVWARGILADQYGVDLSRVTWVLSGDEHVAEYQPPPNVVPVEPGQDVPEMVATGELAAGIGIPGDRPDVVPLIPDAGQAGYDALREHGLYPINHLVVVKDELLSAYPEPGGGPVRRVRGGEEPLRGAAPRGRRQPSRDADRPDVRAGHGDHRRRPAPLRHRTQPGHDRAADPA